MKSVQIGSWKALNETTKVAKITRIAKFRKAVDEIYGEMQMLRESPQRNCENCKHYENRGKIVNFSEEFNLGHKWEANPLGQDPL